jgi:hypothetical protein
MLGTNTVHSRFRPVPAVSSTQALCHGFDWFIWYRLFRYEVTRWARAVWLHGLTGLAPFHLGCSSSTSNQIQQPKSQNGEPPKNWRPKSVDGSTNIDNPVRETERRDLIPTMAAASDSPSMDETQNLRKAKTYLQNEPRSSVPPTSQRHGGMGNRRRGQPKEERDK